MSTATAVRPSVGLPGSDAAQAAAAPEHGLVLALLATPARGAEVRLPKAPGQSTATCQYPGGRRTEVHRLPREVLNDQERCELAVRELLAAAVPEGDWTVSTGVCFVDGRCEDAVVRAGMTRRALAAVVDDLLVLVVVPLPQAPRAAAPCVHLVRPADSGHASGEGAAL